MSQAVADAVRDAGIPAIAVNSTFRLAPWAWMLYAADPEWWHHPSNADAKQFAGIKASCMRVAGAELLLQSGNRGFDPRPFAVRTGNNSGYQALHVAVHTGAKRVILCGFDMHGGHWHGAHPLGLRNTAPDLYPGWCARFDELAPTLEALGVDVVNCTPGSALRAFRFSSLDAECAAFRESASLAPRLPQVEQLP
jgi:hypothetical protein